MGAGASIDKIDKASAQVAAGSDWDEAKFDSIADADGNITLEQFQDVAKEKLFTKWDKNSAGFLEPTEINKVLAVYNDKQWGKLTDEEKVGKCKGILKSFDTEDDKKVDLAAFKDWLKEQVDAQATFEDESTKLVTKLSAAITKSRNLEKLDAVQVESKCVNIDLHGKGAPATKGDSEKYQTAISDINKQEVEIAKDTRTLEEAKAQATEWRK
jgi:hypothetical protein